MPRPASPERISEICENYNKMGLEFTCRKFGIKDKTVMDYVKIGEDNQPSGEDKVKSSLIKKISEKFTVEELQAIAKGHLSQKQYSIPKIDFSGDTYTFGYFTDSHMGSIYFKEHWFDAMVKEFEKSNVQSIMCSGDITDGMTGDQKRGQIYELTHIGYTAQKKYAIEQINKFSGTSFYTVDGNHDRWFIKGSGAIIAEDICASIKNGHFCGHDTADVELNNCKIRLWHGEDGSSYATSYRVQKIVESFQGGDKPNVLLCGHTHKQIQMLERNIHCFSGGCLCSQSGWMRSKRLAAHPGFWIITLTFCEGGIGKVTSSWHSFF